tara:strand:+ start:1604 stop:5062 length:3459 start_codon:yes stop_codon:yes gene_type:complete
LKSSSNAFFDSFKEEDEEVVEENTNNAFFDSFEEEEEEVVPEEKEDTSNAFFKSFEEDEVEDTRPAVEQLELPEETSKSLTEFAEDENFIANVKTYAKSRFGESGAQQEDESNEDYVKRFLTHTRQFETNSLDLGAQVAWMRGASEQEKANFGRVYQEMERLPAFYEEGGTSVLSAVKDFGLSVFTDPLTYLGFGVGKVASMGAQQGVKKLVLAGAKEAALKQSKKLFTKGGLKAGLAVGATEAGVGVIQSLGQQEITQEAGMELKGEDGKVDYDLGEAALFGTIGGVLGFGGGVGLSRKLSKDVAKKEIAKQEALEAAEETIEEGGLELSEEAIDRVNKQNFKFDVNEGYKVYDKLNPDYDIGKLTDVKIKKDIQNRVGQIGVQLLEEIERSGKFKDLPKEILAEKQVTKFVGRLLVEQGDIIDDDVLDAAISRSGLSMEQFTQALNAGQNEAGSILGGFGRAGKVFKRLKELDPEFQKRWENLYGIESETVGVMSKAYTIMQKLDRNRRALMVTQLSTTIRNVATGGMRLTMEMGANAIETSLYHLGKATSAVLRGEGSVRGVRNGLKDMARDAFGTLAFISDSGQTKDISEALLKHNPRLWRQIDRSLQEVGADNNDDLWRFSKWANSLNMAQDRFFRRAVFSASVDKQIRRTGLKGLGGEDAAGVAEALATGKSVPASVLKQATEDALSFTFSRMPKASKGKIGDSIAHHFIKFNESLGPLPGPVGTAAFPFARFMANAMQFQFSYSPLSIPAAAFNTVGGATKYIKKAITGKPVEGAEAQMRLAREQFSKATVGSAALMAAIKYRIDNPEIKWYEGEKEDGRTVDLRPFFPITPYLAVADVIVRLGEGREIDTKQLIEGLTGAQFRAGASSYMIDSAFEFLRADNGNNIQQEKLGEFFGGYVGEIFGAFATPFRVIRDIDAAFRKDSAVVRDSRQTEGSGALERGLSAGTNAFQRNLPFLNSDLPALQSPTQEGDIIQQDPLTTQLTGQKMTARRTAVQKELVKHGYEDYQIIPTTGDKVADAYIKKYMGKLVADSLANEIDSDYYKGLSRVKQEAALKNKLSLYRDIAKTLGEADAIQDSDKEGKRFTPFDRAQWTRMSKVGRKLADEYYKEKYGKSVAEMQKEEPDTNHFYIGKTIGNSLSTAYQ